MTPRERAKVVCCRGEPLCRRREPLCRATRTARFANGEARSATGPVGSRSLPMRAPSGPSCCHSSLDCTRQERDCLTSVAVLSSIRSVCPPTGTVVGASDPVGSLPGPLSSRTDTVWFQNGAVWTRTVDRRFPRPRRLATGLALRSDRDRDRDRDRSSSVRDDRFSQFATAATHFAASCLHSAHVAAEPLHRARRRGSARTGPDETIHRGTRQG